MKFFPDLARRIRQGDAIPAPLALALTACTPAVRIGMAARKRRRVHRVKARVISFGNITAGGTGKTPAVIERAQLELAAGHRVAVLTRGYAAPSGNRPGDSTQLQGASPYKALGDEAALILQKCPGVIVVKNADRVAGAQRAIELGCDTLLLDDGFQYLRLARDENIVVIDSTSPFGNEQLIPRGILREPLPELRRATQIVLTRADQAHDLAALTARLRTLAPGIPLRTTLHAPTALRNLATGTKQALTTLRGQHVVAMCGIGNPESFAATLENLGAIIDGLVATSDHTSARKSEISTAGLLITTEKDAVRADLPLRSNILILEIALADTK